MRKDNKVYRINLRLGLQSYNKLIEKSEKERLPVSTVARRLLESAMNGNGGHSGNSKNEKADV